MTGSKDAAAANASADDTADAPADDTADAPTDIDTPDTPARDVSDLEDFDTSIPDDALVEVIHAHGHEHVTAEHTSTFEFTTDEWLTPAGDCIIGVGTDRTPRDFDPAFKRACRDAAVTIAATIAVHGEEETYEITIMGRGDPDLTLVDDRSMVGRTSTYTDDERTIMVEADTAAADLDRDLVRELASGAPMTMRLAVY